MATHIVMLGTGYVSTWAYRSIVRRLGSQVRKGEVRISVISPESFHVFHGYTAETLTGVIAFENRLSPIAEIMPLARHIEGWAVGIHPCERMVQYKNKAGIQMSMRYDHLLVGMGSFDSHKIEGIQSHGFGVKDVQMLRQTIERIDELLKQASRYPEQASQLLRIAVIGAGFTGVEIAANLAEYLRLRCKQIPSLREAKPCIILIGSTEEILPELKGQFKTMLQYARRQLTAYGVELRAGQRVAEILPDGVRLESGDQIDATMVISTAGQSRMVLAGTENMLRDTQDRLQLNAYLRVPGEPNIWGGGDACHVKHCRTKLACPSNALWAIKHGEHAGKNIARAIQGKKLLHFSYPGLGQAASLGMGKGITELYGIPFTGWLAWIMRWFFFNYFMPSRRTLIRSLGDWLRCWFTSKRLALTGKKESIYQPLPVHEPVTRVSAA